MEKIIITAEDGEKIEFFVVEQTRVNGMNFLLVTDSEDDEEADAYILRDVAQADDTEAVYEFVEDEQELQALAKVFSELVDDAEII